MRPAARMTAAVEVLADVLERHMPASRALSEWGRAHRFAGSGDRAAIGTLVFDALRKRRSIGAVMGNGSPRALVLGAAGPAFGLSPEEVIAAADGSQHALSPPDEAERAGIEKIAARQEAAGEAGSDDLPPDVAGDIPEWLFASFERAFGARAQAEGAALAARAPIDLRANLLKAEPEKIIKALRHAGAEPAPLSPWGVRIRARAGAAKSPNVEAETGHGKGWFEVQDAGSQVAAAMTGAGPRLQVLDLCAGAGGKTLALAAMMQNTGQLYAYDADKAQLRPIFERLKRAGARNVQVMDGGDETALEALAGRFDVVLVDAPCSGTGTWRRRPDAKWRLKQENLDQRREEQATLLEKSALMVKPGGRVVYVTCSVLPEENTDQVASFLKEHAGVRVVPFADVWKDHLPGPPPVSADGRQDTLLLTPGQHDTDGFFVAVLEWPK